MKYKHHMARSSKNTTTQTRDFPTVCEDSLCKHRVSFYLPYPDKERMSHRLISGLRNQTTICFRDTVLNMSSNKYEHNSLNQ